MIDKHEGDHQHPDVRQAFNDLKASLNAARVSDRD